MKNTTKNSKATKVNSTKTTQVKATRTHTAKLSKPKNASLAKRLDVAFRLTANGKVKGTICGESMTRVICQLAAMDWTPSEVVKFMELVGGTVSMNTIYSQMNSAKLSMDKKVKAESIHHGVAPGYRDEPKFESKTVKLLKDAHKLCAA